MRINARRGGRWGDRKGGRGGREEGRHAKDSISQEDSAWPVQRSIGGSPVWEYPCSCCCCTSCAAAAVIVVLLLQLRSDDAARMCPGFSACHRVSLTSLSMMVLGPSRGPDSNPPSWYTPPAADVAAAAEPAAPAPADEDAAEAEPSPDVPPPVPPPPPFLSCEKREEKPQEVPPCDAAPFAAALPLDLPACMVGGGGGRLKRER